jgi:hypothetical protein
MAGNSGEVRKVRISSLSAFLMLGAVSATDVKTSFYYDYSRPGTQLASGPGADGTNLASEGQKASRVATDDSMMVQLGQGMIFPEIGQGLRELTSLHRCWRNGERRDGLSGNVARLCTALREPL